MLAMVVSSSGRVSLVPTSVAPNLERANSPRIVICLVGKGVPLSEPLCLPAIACGGVCVYWSRRRDYGCDSESSCW
jgi:hypothetical protein